MQMALSSHDAGNSNDKKCVESLRLSDRGWKQGKLNARLQAIALALRFLH